LGHYAGITLAQVKVTQDEFCQTIAVLDCIATAHETLQPLIMPLSNIIAVLLNVSRAQLPRMFALLLKPMMKTMVMVLYFFCFLQDFFGATHEALVLAEEALYPMKLSLSNFNQDVKASTARLWWKHLQRNCAFKSWIGARIGEAVWQRP
jgi:hypothetical protein